MACQLLASLAIYGLLALSSSAEYVRWQPAVGQHKEQSIGGTEDGSLYEGALLTPEKIAELHFRRFAAAQDALQLEPAAHQLVQGVLSLQMHGPVTTS